MSFEEDEEILQDFLVEAGEILETLSEQLVDLENKPDDNDLLNAIFRGVHTIKGGGGFLQLNELVEICHVTESMFDLLRGGKLKVNTELMDVALQSLDCCHSMFAQVQERSPLEAAPPELIKKIEQICSGDSIAPPVEEAAAVVPEAAAVTPEPAAVDGKSEDITDQDFELFVDSIQEPGGKDTSVDMNVAVAAGSDNNEITEDEFDSLLNQIHGDGKIGGANAPSVSAPAPASSDGTITDDEFEGLLDQLHGAGQGPNGKGAATTSDAVPEPAKACGDGAISEDEFDDLLDQLHGAGQGPNSKGAVASTPVSAPESAPTPTPEAAPAVESKSSKVQKKTAAPASKGKETAVAAETTVRVDTKRLDDIMNMVGELVLVRNRLVRLGLKSGDEEMSKAVSNLDVVTADLQTSVMKTRMQPIKKVFGRFPRVVRDLARNLKKEITLELEGEETDLDKNLVEALADPLVHLVRNSVDHGVEMPDEREAAGKSRVGKVVLAAEQEGDHILLSISDDGAGMDADVLRRKAIEKGLFDEDSAARLSESECFDLIFMPGFSTKQEISDVSGRGVGMDVVKTKITQLNGSIEIKSVLGEGTRIIIKVPLTLAIMPTLMVMLGGQTFALPLVSVNEIFHMDLSRTNVVDGQEVVTVREKALPLFYLKRWLVGNPFETEQSDTAHVVIVSVGSRRVGFVVDSLIGQEEVVIKPLGQMLQGTPGMAGATITGDGRIALILDVPSMLNRYVG